MRFWPDLLQDVTVDDISSALKILEMLAEIPAAGPQFIEVLTVTFAHWDTLLVFDVHFFLLAYLTFLLFWNAGCPYFVSFTYSCFRIHSIGEARY